MSRHVAARPRRPLARALVAGLATLSLAGGLAAAAGAPAQAAGGTVLLEDNFMSASVTGTSYVAGGINTTACLTAGSNTAQTPIPGCGGVVDADGSGALRLTPAQNDRAGFLVYDKALPTKAGLDITFNQYQWGGTLADGISFFLANGNQNLTRAGAFGGSLGYNNQGATTANPGVPNALLGVGFDVYGNYTVETHNAGCADTGLRGSAPANHKYTVAVRGPGNGTSGYCLLSSAQPAGELNKGSVSSRPAAVVTRVVVDPPSNPSPKVTVYLDGRQAVQVDQPAALQTTPTFKFGWGASTGGQNNNHEINFLKVESVNPILPDLGVAGLGQVVDAGTSTTLSWTVDADAASGPVPADETVHLQAAAPSGTTFGTPSGTGWSCGTSTATLVDCTRTSGTAVAPGTTFPPVSVLASAGSASGRQTVTATVSSPSNDPTLATDDTSATEVRWRPVVQPVEADEIDASATPSPVTVDPVVSGTGPFTISVSAPLDPATGSVSVVDGRLVLTPAAGQSGVLSAQYTATDADGVQSNPAEVLVLVRPTVADAARTVDAGDAVSHQVPTPMGRGPFTWELLPYDTSYGTFAIDQDGLLTGQVAGSVSGALELHYRVQDEPYGVTSQAGVLTLTVRPVAGSTTQRVVLDADGEATTQVTLPAPSGTGPFRYELGTVPAGVTASVTGGVLTVTAATGTSGTAVVPYTVVDGNEVRSTERTVTVDVAPYLAAPGATGTADATTTAPAPTVLGTSPFGWDVQAPAGVDATVAADGRVTLDTHGASGTFDVLLIVEDADGVTSSDVVSFDVHPVAHDVAADTTASATPAPTRLTPTAPVGTGTGAFTVVQGLAPADGSVVVDGQSLLVTPAAGFSGLLEVGYTVTGADGLASAPATATLRVSPVALASSGSLESGTAAAFVLPTPVGRGAFVAELVSAASGPFGSVAVVGGELRFAAASTFSGQVVVQYRVTDAAGLVSAPADVVVDVVPATPGGTTPTSARPGGTAGSPVTGPTPQPTGTGPFTFELVGTVPPSVGTATIDPATGVITFVPAPGWSGEAPVRYRVVDGNGDPSAPSEVVFVVAPVAPGAPAPTTTVAGTPVTVTLPAPVGTGPFTWTIVTGPTPQQGTLVLDQATGELRFVPAPGYTGSFEVTYTVTDASGLVSAPQVLGISVTAAPVPPAAAVPQVVEAARAVVAATLPRTGTELAVAAGLAGALVLAGGALLLLTRRRTAG